MFAVKTKRRLRAHKSHTIIALLIASAMVWTFSLIIHILWYYTLYLNLFLAITNAFKCFCIVVIVWCNVIVYRETLRHKQQIANHRVTQEIRENFLKDKKAFKVTNRIVILLFLCYLPTIISRIILDKYIPRTEYL